jgi:hypothetical protein
MELDFILVQSYTNVYCGNDELFVIADCPCTPQSCYIQTDQTLRTCPPTILGNLCRSPPFGQPGMTGTF